MTTKVLAGYFVVGGGRFGNTLFGELFMDVAQMQRELHEIQSHDGYKFVPVYVNVEDLPS